MEIPNPNQKVKEKISERFSFVRSLFCIIAGAIPKSLNTLKNVMITIAIAIIPKSSGDIILANTADTINDTIIPLYLDIALYATPVNRSFFSDTSFEYYFIYDFSLISQGKSNTSHDFIDINFR